MLGSTEIFNTIITHFSIILYISHPTITKNVIILSIV